MARRIWIVNSQTVITQDVIAEAARHECSEIATGIPPALRSIVTEDMLPCAYQEPLPAESPAPSHIHWAQVDSFHVGEQKPLRVKRQLVDRLITVDCYATETVKDLYTASELAVDDIVLVVFVEGDLDKPIALDKVYGV